MEVRKQSPAGRREPRLDKSEANLAGAHGCKLEEKDERIVAETAAMSGVTREEMSVETLKARSGAACQQQKIRLAVHGALPLLHGPGLQW